MHALRIVQDIEIPKFEIIAECWINSTLIYLWRNYCWAVANDKNNIPLIKTEQKFIDINLKTPKNKTIIIYKINNLKIPY